jgi:hypothetical protein
MINLTTFRPLSVFVNFMTFVRNFDINRKDDLIFNMQN